MKSDSLHGHSTEIRIPCHMAEHFSAKEVLMNVVYVLAPDGTPLMPCSCVIARLLLKDGKAKVRRRTPFTIKLLIQPETTYTQSLTLGVDTGSSVIGSAIADEQGNVVYLSEVTVRNDIATTMKQRAKYRRNRRTRKTETKTGWFSPTMKSKIDAHLREIRFVQSLLLIRSIVLETSTFDPHALKNPEVLRHKWLYQKGINYGFANTKAYVLTRDGYTCQQCKGKSKDRRLEVHHIIFRSQNGSDEETNLITLCKTCHKEHRLLVGLPKKHCFDAAVIATRGITPNFQVSTLLAKRCVPDGDYQQTKGIRSEQRIITGKIRGFRKFDKVRYQGQEYFIKGRMSTGYAILMDLAGNKVGKKPIPKFEQMVRVNARASWIMEQHALPEDATHPRS